MHLFEEPGKDLTLHLICGCAWGAVKSWDGWGRELCCAPLVCPWDSEQTLPALCSFLVDFLPWIITHVKPHTLDILRGEAREKDVIVPIHLARRLGAQCPLGRINCYLGSLCWSFWQWYPGGTHTELQKDVWVPGAGSQLVIRLSVFLLVFIQSKLPLTPQCDEWQVACIL